MDGEEFQQFVVEKLINIENRITSLESKVGQYDKVAKVALAIAAALAAKLGIDLTGVI